MSSATQFPSAMTLRLTQEMADDLEELASKIGWSRSVLIRRCLAASIQAVRQFEIKQERGL